MNFNEAILNYQPINKQEKSDKEIILDYIDHFYDNILTRENQIAHMTSSGLILNDSLDKILMIYHNIYNTWTWTGGHADEKEKLVINEEETSGVNWIEVNRLTEYSNEPYLIEIYKKIIDKARS
ncbi:hypothetical protein [Proteiniborus sp.]|uniref:hypothetical protein n=1 Tax=Proteiniborus sp. TaxID=2079015 RepID=UPI0033222A84